MISIIVQKNSVFVYTAHLDSFAYLICYEHVLGSYVHKGKFDLA